MWCAIINLLVYFNKGCGVPLAVDWPTSANNVLCHYQLISLLQQWLWCAISNYLVYFKKCCCVFPTASSTLTQQNFFSWISRTCTLIQLRPLLVWNGSSHYDNETVYALTPTSSRLTFVFAYVLCCVVWHVSGRTASPTPGSYNIRTVPNIPLYNVL